MKERSLVFFTVLMQAAIGLVFVLVAVLLIVYLANLQALGLAYRYLKLPGVYYGMVGLLALPAMGLSLFHLGHPSRAYLALSNLRSSWLSREIFSGLIFVSMWAVFCLFIRIWEANLEAAVVFGFAWAVAGYHLMENMASVYSLPSSPGWSKKAVMVEFSRTTYILGLTAAGFLFALASLNELTIHQMTLSRVVILGTVCGSLLAGVWHFVTWSRFQVLSWQKKPAGQPLSLLLGLLVTITVELGLIVLFILEKPVLHSELLVGLAGLVFGLTLVVELSLRARFYRNRQPVL